MGLDNSTLYNLSLEDTLNLIAIKGGAISDLVDDGSVKETDKIKAVHELAGEIAQLNSILFVWIMNLASTKED